MAVAADRSRIRGFPEPLGTTGRTSFADWLRVVQSLPMSITPIFSTGGIPIVHSPEHWPYFASFTARGVRPLAIALIASVGLTYLAACGESSPAQDSSAGSASQSSVDSLRGTMRDSMLIQFNVTNPQIKLTDVVAGGPPKDGIPALTNPKRINVADATDFPASGARVIEVVVNNEAVAYPIGILNWHEIVNDNVGDTPIAVTYCPLCDSVSVFDRRLPPQKGSGQPTTLEFGVSGLLYNSNVLMFERNTDALWSQVYMKAVTGPQAGRSLRQLPVRMTTFADFKKSNPAGKVLSKDTGYPRNYSANPYQRYFDDPDVVFHQFEFSDELPPKTLGLGIKTEADNIFITWKKIIESNGEFTVETKDHKKITIKANKAGMYVESAPENLQAIQTFYHSWSAFYRETRVIMADSEKKSGSGAGAGDDSSTG